MIYHNTSSTLSAHMQAKTQADKQADISHGVSGFLVWLRLWMAHAAQGLLTDIWRPKTAPQVTGYQRPSSLLPDNARSAMAPRVLVSRRARRILARGLPASRRYFGYEHLNARQLTGNQFLERAVRLSVSSRTVIYGLEYRLRLCQSVHMRERHHSARIFSVFKAKPRSTQYETLNTGLNTGLNAGLCAAHLWPN